MAESSKKNNFYAVSYPVAEECICRMEINALFREEIDKKYFFSDIKIDPSRSPYIRHSLFIFCREGSLEGLVDYIHERKLAFHNFKFAHFAAEGDELGYADWITCVTRLGAAIDGEADMHSPSVLLGLAKIEGLWLFGEYARNDNEWRKHDGKPHKNSHSVGLILARALVNIAVQDAHGCTLVDPCCGIGTVVIEALSMAVDVKGYEINGSIAEKAKENLVFFGYRDVIRTGDMHEIKDFFDAAIVDMPYGLFTPVTRESQLDLIKTARRIARRLVLLTFEDMDDAITAAGFSIVDACTIAKGHLTRYVRVCL